MKTNILYLVGAIIAATHLSLGFAAVPVKFTDPVRFTELPPAVQNTLNNQVGAAEIASIDRVDRNGVPLYRVQLKVGSHQPIYISETGSLITPDSITGSNLGHDGSRKGSFNELPTAAQNTVRGQAGIARIDSVDLVTKDSQTHYAVTFKREGKTVQLLVDPAGNILSGGQPATATTTVSRTRVPLSAATKVTLNDLPAVAENTLSAYTNGAEIEDIDKGTLQGKTVYEAAFKFNGQNTELRVAEDGSIVRDDVNDRYLDAIGKVPANAAGLNANPAMVDWRSAPARVPLSAATKLNSRDLPAAVQSTLRTYSGIARIEDIDKGTLGGQTVYEAAFKDRGHNIELRIAEDGSLIMDQPNAHYVSQYDRQFPAAGRPPGWQGLTGRGASNPAGETALSFEQLPIAVQSTLRSQAGASAIENITQTRINGTTVYQATIQRNGQNTPVQVSEDGSLTR